MAETKEKDYAQLLRISPKASTISKFFHDKFQSEMWSDSRKKLWKKKLMPKIRAGYVDALVDSPKEGGLKDEILMGLAALAMDDSYSHIDYSEVASYPLELASLVRNPEKKNTLYRGIAMFYNHIKESDSNYFEAMLAAYANIHPKDEAEANKLREFSEKYAYEYAQSKLAGSDLGKARKFFEMCGAQDMIEMIDRVENPKKIKKMLKNYAKNKAILEKQKKEAGTGGIESVLKRD